MAVSNISSIGRRLSALEAALGDGGGEDFGPTTVVTLTRYWHGADPNAADADDRRQDGAWREQQIVDATVAEIRAEARRRREPVGVIMIGIDDDGQVAVSGVPWLPNRGQLAWVGESLREGRTAR